MRHRRLGLQWLGRRPFGGTIRLAEGWTDGPVSADAGRALRPDEVGAIVADLVARRHPPKPVYGTAA